MKDSYLDDKCPNVKTQSLTKSYYIQFLPVELSLLKSLSLYYACNLKFKNPVFYQKDYYYCVL